MKLIKRVEQIQEKINPLVSDEEKIMTEKIGLLIKEAEKALGRTPKPPFDLSKPYTEEELLVYYKRDY